MERWWCGPCPACLTDPASAPLLPSHRPLRAPSPAPSPALPSSNPTPTMHSQRWAADKPCEGAEISHPRPAPAPTSVERTEGQVAAAGAPGRRGASGAVRRGSRGGGPGVPGSRLPEKAHLLHLLPYRLWLTSWVTMPTQPARSQPAHMHASSAAPARHAPAGPAGPIHPAPSWSTCDAPRPDQLVLHSAGHPPPPHFQLHRRPPSHAPTWPAVFFLPATQPCTHLTSWFFTV